MSSGVVARESGTRQSAIERTSETSGTKCLRSRIRFACTCHGKQRQTVGGIKPRYGCLGRLPGSIRSTQSPFRHLPFGVIDRPALVVKCRRVAAALDRPGVRVKPSGLGPPPREATHAEAIFFAIACASGVAGALLGSFCIIETEGEIGCAPCAGNPIGMGDRDESPPRNSR